MKFQKRELFFCKGPLQKAFPKMARGDQDKNKDVKLKD